LSQRQIASELGINRETVARYPRHAADASKAARDFAGSVPATRDSLPPLDRASLIPVSAEKTKKKTERQLVR